MNIGTRSALRVENSDVHSGRAISRVSSGTTLSPYIEGVTILWFWNGHFSQLTIEVAREDIRRALHVPVNNRLFWHGSFTTQCASRPVPKRASRTLIQAP